MNNRSITQPQINELRKGRGLMSKSNPELTDIIPFKESDLWYLKLVYKYEDKKGKHTVVIPKAGIPFCQGCIPAVKFTLEHRYIECNDSMPLYDVICSLAVERGIEDPACYFDIITEYVPREMTLDQIEKELGYKVKIINKEKPSNAKT